MLISCDDGHIRCLLSWRLTNLYRNQEGKRFWRRMKGSGLRKLGWHWTRKGWKRLPKHLQQVKKVPRPTKRKTRKTVRISSAKPREKPPIFGEARKLAVECGRVDSALNPGPEAARPAPRQMRRAWSGKYDDLTILAKGEP